MVWLYSWSKLITNTMKKYFLVQNGNIVDDPKDLPVNFQNISNFNTLDDITVASYGWYVQVDVVNGSGSVLSNTTDTISGNTVVRTLTYRDPTAEELSNALNTLQLQQANAMLSLLRAQALEFISSSLYNQLTTDNQKLWQDYYSIIGEELSDINVDYSKSNISWPVKPSMVNT